MQRLTEHLRITAGPAGFLRAVLAKAEHDLNQLGLTLIITDHAQFLELNERYRDRRWYALHDNYRHPKFLGVGIATDDLKEVRAITATKPLDLNGRNFGETLADMTFAYPNGVPIGSTDKLEGIPLAAYSLTGKASYIGGLWIDNTASPRTGLSGSILLSYLSRVLLAVILGTENPDVAISLVVDGILRGRLKGRSIVDRYGFIHVAKGPNWVNHYPNEDLQLNCIWGHRATILTLIADTPWVAELNLMPKAPA